MDSATPKVHQLHCDTSVGIMPATLETRALIASDRMNAMRGRSVLVVGGSSGIGFEVAKQAAELGARLTIVGRNQTKLLDAAAALGGSVQTIAADAHDDEAVEELFARLDPLDHVVSLVGDSMSGGFLQTSRETMWHVLASKFWANWTIGCSSARKLRAGGSLTFTSGSGGRPQDVSATYVANQGIAALVEGLAAELAPHIRVNAVAPTFMGRGTSFWKDISPEQLQATEAAFVATVPLGRLATVEEVASTYLHLMLNGYITGQVVAVDGGVMRRK
jgi:NAD(P)-dependent dehydrogenase (short-subunit alcohol dehydrogenase family)